MLIHEIALNDQLYREREFHFDQTVTLGKGTGREGHAMEGGGSIRILARGRHKVYASIHPVRVVYAPARETKNPKKGK